MCPCEAKSQGSSPFTDLWGHMALNGVPVYSERPVKALLLGASTPGLMAQTDLEKSLGVTTGNGALRTAGTDSDCLPK